MGIGRSRRALLPTMRAAFLLLLPALGLLSGCSSEEEKLTEMLTELSNQLPLRSGEAMAFRALRIQKEFRPVLAEQVDVDGGLVRPDRYERDLVLRGLTSLRGYRIEALELEQLDVRVRGDATATARGVAALSASQAGDLHAEKFKFEFTLRKRGGGWLIERAVLGDARPELPEARP